MSVEINEVLFICKTVYSLLLPKGEWKLFHLFYCGAIIFNINIAIIKHKFDVYEKERERENFGLSSALLSVIFIVRKKQKVEMKMKGKNPLLINGNKL